MARFFGYCSRRGLRDNSSDDNSSARDGFVSGISGEATAPEQRDRLIPLRKSDLIDGLVAAGQLDNGAQARFRQFARQLGALFHYQYFEQLDLLREAYFHFDPEVDPQACGPQQDLETPYRRLS